MEENEVQKLRRDLNINPEMYIWKNITGALVTDTQGSLYLLNGHRCDYIDNTGDLHALMNSLFLLCNFLWPL